MKFYEFHYPKRDANGIMQMEGVGAVETYQGVTNPATEIGGIKYVLTKMLSFETDAARRRHWSALLKAMPGVPLRKIRGLDLLAVGDKYAPGGMAGAGDSGEHPELYTIYPFRQVWLGRPQLLNVARQSFHLRIVSLDGSRDTRSMETGGWQMTPVQAAYLGLPREAARLTSINFNDQFIFYCDNFDPDAPYGRGRPVCGRGGDEAPCDDRSGLGRICRAGQRGRAAAVCRRRTGCRPRRAPVASDGAVARLRRDERGAGRFGRPVGGAGRLPRDRTKNPPGAVMPLPVQLNQMP